MEVKLNNYIIFDNKAYKELPGRVSSNMSMFGVSFDTRSSLSGSTVRVVRPVVTDNIYETTPRLSKYSIIELNWDSNTFTTVCMVDQLNVLAKANKPFMFMFDNEFSETDDTLVKISDVEYLLPTYPLAHLKQTVNNSVQYDYAIDVKINGVDAGNSNSYYINNTTGSIIFSNALLATDVVTATYKWAIWCKINNISHKNIGNIARNAYELSVILEQLDFPDNITEDAYKYVVSDCRECPIDSPVVSDNNPGDDDPDDETSTEICASPTIFNNDGTNIVSGSSNQWGDYTGAFPWASTLDNHRYSDGNEVGVRYPLYMYDDNTMFSEKRTKSDVLKLDGANISVVPAERKVSKVFVELDIITENGGTHRTNVIDTLAEITLSSSNYVVNLAKYSLIQGSNTARYECIPTTTVYTDDIVANGISFKYQVAEEITHKQVSTTKYDAASWSISLNTSSLVSPNSTNDFTGRFTFTGTYIGEGDAPETINYYVDQYITHNFSYSGGSYSTGAATIDGGMGYVKNLGIDNTYDGSNTNNFYYGDDHTFECKVSNGMFTLNLDVNVSATTTLNGTVIPYKTTIAIYNHGVVLPENITFDTRKLLQSNPVTLVSQWSAALRQQKIVRIRRYDFFTPPAAYVTKEAESFLTAPYTGSLEGVTVNPLSGVSPNNGEFYSETTSDICYYYTYTGAGSPPPYAYIPVTLDMGYGFQQSQTYFDYKVRGGTKPYGYLKDQMNCPIEYTYNTYSDGLASVSLLESARKRGNITSGVTPSRRYNLIKVPVVNGVAKFFLHDLKAIAGCNTIAGAVVAGDGYTPKATTYISGYTDNLLTPTTRDIKIEQARVGICWVEPVDSGEKGVVNDLVSYEFSPTSTTTTTSTASTAIVEKTFTFDDSLFTSLSDDTYTVGAEVSTFTTQYDSPVNGTLNTAVAKAKLSYVASSVGFIEYVKSAQNVDNTSHSSTGFIDTTNDKTFGGLYDYFGKTQPDLNKANIISNDGLVVYAKYNQTTPVGLVFTSGHYTLGTTVTATGSFSSGSSLLSGNTDGYGGTPGATLTWTGASTSGRGALNSATLIEVTNTNAGTLRPKYVYLTVNSTCYYSYTCTSHKSIISDGFAYSTYNTTNPNTSVNSVKVKVPLGPDKKGYYLLNQGVTFDIVGATSITASTGVSALIATQQEAPDITDVKIKLHTVLPSSTDSVVFQYTTGSPTGIYDGTYGNIFRSSLDGSADTWYVELLAPYNLNLPTGSTDIVTGIEVSCDAKAMTAKTITDNINFGFVYGPSELLSSAIAVPVTNLTGKKLKLVAGGNTNLWGATPTVADILDGFTLHIDGINDAGEILQLSNIRLKIYYVKLQ